MITMGDNDFFFRPSLLAMTRIGEPGEIVRTFYDLCNDEVTPLLQRAADAYRELERVPDCVLQYIHSGLLTRKAIMAAHTVLTACCDDDIGVLVGWMRPARSRRRGMVWRPGSLPAQDMIIIAQNLMAHGIVGKAKLRRLQRHETNETTSGFVAADYVVAARNHFGMSRAEAEQLTMTEFQLMVAAKYPDQKGYTREEYDGAADAFFARRKRKQARAAKTH
ncbi:Uncharacterised protein [Pluralibacter gergoviae]|nr:Uncharacterised protein [Pluralibacter gergoviae]